MYVLIPVFDLFQELKYPFFLLSIFVDELMSTLKIITFLPNPVPGNDKLPCLSNPIPYPEYFYLPISSFLARLTASNNFLVSDNCLC